MFEEIITSKEIKFNDLEKKVFKFVCFFGCLIIKIMLEAYDRKIIENRDKKKYRHKGLRETSAIRAIGRNFEEPVKEIRAKEVVETEKNAPSDKLRELLSEKPRIINIGLKSFAEVVEEFGCEVVQYDWMPPAGGNIELIKTLNFLRNYEGIDEKNREVVAKIVASQPY